MIGDIRTWVRETFAGPEPKTFFELGAHCGEDTAWLAAIPGVTLHAFEPDPRNEVLAPHNVVLNRAAVSNRDGRCLFHLSAANWTFSSSIRAPKSHLVHYPSVHFEPPVEVECVSLDGYAKRRGVGRVDFIWADIQGAEVDAIHGGRALLERTRYVYMEYSDRELYEGQLKLADLLQLLPGFRVLGKWNEDQPAGDVLLANTRTE